jgi:DNA-binding HxlR family transcriptional regulator
MNALTLPQRLALLGLAHAADRGQTQSEIRRALGKEVKPLLAPSEALEDSLRQLAERGLIEETPRPPRSRVVRWRLLAAGRGMLSQQFGDAAFQKRGAIARAAALLLISEKLGLPPGAARRVLSRRSALLACLLAHHLGEPFDEHTTLDALAARVAARAIGAGNTQTATLRESLLRQALGGSTLTSTPACPIANLAPAPDFPASVLRASRAAPPGAWFGPRKLFIHRAWEAWRADGGDAAVDLPAFKTRLLAALRAGQIGLTRADFTATLDPADIAAAELRDGSETFHFLTADRDSRPTP